MTYGQLLLASRQKTAVQHAQTHHKGSLHIDGPSGREGGVLSLLIVVFDGGCWRLLSW